jgi:hypothetical protein
MLMYFVFPTMVGVYALITALIYHWLGAYVVAGVSFGCVNAFLSLRWRRPTKWFHWMPYVLVLAAGIEAILEHFHFKLRDTCLTFVLATFAFYAYLVLEDRAQKRLEQMRSILEAELFAAFTKIKPGESTQFSLTRRDGALLEDAFFYLRNCGWRIDRFPATSLFQPQLRGWFYFVVAPPTEELWQASLDHFYSRYDE